MKHNLFFAAIGDEDMSCDDVCCLQVLINAQQEAFVGLLPDRSVSE